MCANLQAFLCRSLGFAYSLASHSLCSFSLFFHTLYLSITPPPTSDAQLPIKIHFFPPTLISLMSKTFQIDASASSSLIPLQPTGMPSAITLPRRGAIYIPPSLPAYNCIRPFQKEVKSHIPSSVFIPGLLGNHV